MNTVRELLKNKERSMVEVRNESGKVTKYVVCSYFNPTREYGNMWELGHYFDVWDGADAQKQMEAAARYLYDIKAEPIPYNRLSEITTLLKDGLMEDDEESAIEYMKETCNLSEKEADYFGIKEKLFPTKYKVVEVTMKRGQYCTIRIVMPADKENYDVDDYIECECNLEPDWGNEGDWEVDNTSVVDSEISKEEFNRKYDCDSVWNADDIDEI